MLKGSLSKHSEWYFFLSIDSINQTEQLILNQHELLSEIIEDPNHEGLSTKADIKNASALKMHHIRPFPLRLGCYTSLSQSHLHGERFRL